MDSNHRSKMQQIYSLPPLATREPLHIQLKSGAGDGTRTRNLLITNQLLCQLSYTSTGLGKSSIINFTLTIITQEYQFVKHFFDFFSGYEFFLANSGN